MVVEGRTVSKQRDDKLEVPEVRNGFIQLVFCCYMFQGGNKITQRSSYSFEEHTSA